MDEPRKSGRPRTVEPEQVIADFAEHGSASTTARLFGITAERVRQLVKQHAPQLFAERAQLREAAKPPKQRKHYPKEKRPFFADRDLASEAGTAGAKSRWTK